MFVEQLSYEQITEFVTNNLQEDIHPELLRFRNHLVNYQGEWAREIWYCSKTVNAHRGIYLMDATVTPELSRNFEEAWIKYLYSIFGEDYKEWYLEKTKDYPGEMKVALT